MRHARILLRLLLPAAILSISILSVSCAQGRRKISPKASAVPLERAFPHLSFTRPVDLQNAGDGTNRIFVVEQKGRILVFPNDQNTPQAKLFLDIVSRVKSTGNEEGLLGLAFHPDFRNNGYFFVDYTRPTTGAGVSQTTISRFKVSAADPDAADPASETIILQITQPYENHNGGQIVFGPDGFLYIAMGDGGSGGDPLGNGQNRKVLLGKILRIDVDHPSGGNAYGIPADNPFVGNLQGWREEIWTWGMRNPWRFSYDRETGRWWCGDVGQNLWEEVDILRKGCNYGWNVMEGTHCYSPSTGCDTTGLTPPVLDYGRTLGACVTGGFVYRGAQAPALTGAYIYGDYVSGRVWALRYDGTRVTENTELIGTGNISSFGMDEKRELYLCEFDGRLYRFARSSSGRIKVDAANLDFGAVPANGSKTLPLHISNEGADPLAIDAAAISGADSAAFTTDFTGARIIQPGESTLVNVSFLPRRTGSFSALLTVASSDSASPAIDIPLEGTGTPLTGVSEGFPSGFRFLSLYPNPVAPGTGARATIEYELPARTPVDVGVFDLRGARVRQAFEGMRDPGRHSLQVDPEQLRSGVYLVRLRAGALSKTRMLIVDR